jgi:hypothetical protein
MASEVGGLDPLHGYLKHGNLVVRMRFPYLELEECGEVHRAEDDDGGAKVAEPRSAGAGCGQSAAARRSVQVAPREEAAEGREKEQEQQPAVNEQHPYFE